MATAVQPTEEQKQQGLDRMKRRATGLLVLATGVFLAARWWEAAYPWLAYVRATAEASMVGGLADWFAVTALFRRPLGLPIPHTAIIPTRKDRVGRSLGGFIQRNFLSREVISAKLRAMHAAEHLARWLSDPVNSRLIARRAASGLAAAAHVLRDDDVQAMIDRGLESRLRRTQVAPLLGRLLGVVTENGRHQELLDGAIALIARAVAEHRGAIRDKIEAESPWWVPGVVDDKIHQKIVAALERTLREIHDDDAHPLRARFDAMLHEFIVKLQSAPDVIERAEHLKQELLDADVTRRFSSSLWADAKSALTRFAENPDAYAPGTIEQGLTAFGEAVLADPELLEKMERGISDVALYLVDRYQDEVSELIAGTVRAWDPDATSRRIELAIGRDLQYIRINGTLVGGLAGLVLFSLSRVFGR